MGYYFLNSVLAKRLIISIILFSSVLTLVITLLQISSRYQQELSDFYSVMSQIETTELEPIARSVWLVDEQQIQTEINGLVQLNDINFVAVKDEDGIIKWNSGNPDIKNELQIEFPLIYQYRDRDLTIGYLLVKGSLDNIYGRIINELLVILGSNALKTILVALFVLYIFYEMMGRHILQLAGIAKESSQTGEMPEFKLNRRQRFSGSKDELDQLTSAFNQMTSKLKQKEEDLRILAEIAEQSPNSIVLTDHTGNILYVNSSFVEISGYSFQEVYGHKPGMVSAKETPAKVYQELWSTILSGKTWVGELLNKRKNGEKYWERATIKPLKDKQGKIINFLATKEDVTLRKNYEDELLFQANYDQLTKLPNRALAMDRLKQSVHASQREDSVVATLMIDLDHFKNINDTLGHATGDLVLVEAAERFKQCVREDDTVARLGGDEFLIIIPKIHSFHNAETVAKKIIESLIKPFCYEGKELFVSPSIGISIATAGYSEPEIMLRDADSAMYRAKNEGRNRFAFFTQSMNDEVKARMEMDGLLRKAIKNNELELYYQPVIDATTRAVVGSEALLRWHNEKLCTVPPDIFIPLAEESEVINDIGRWVLNNATTQMMSSEVNRSLWLSVNVSARQFRAENFIETVESALEQSGLAANRLKVEITEGLLLSDDNDVLMKFNELRKLGVHIAIDDFGTGYSALSYLKRFPVDTLKIDRSFIIDIVNDGRSAALAISVIQMAAHLNLDVVIEGVELEAQFNLLTQHSHVMIQGYLFSRPLPFDEFKEYLSSSPAQ
ncbi:MAG: EAL domain-containing protein, partial [Gammaproteobacteria bacterium]|nr:EAL domain-containing protein [Gammaproteobacteria bacterium]